MKKITIKAPFAKPNMIVWVHNYRSKRKDGQQVWEPGALASAKYDFGYSCWSYEVRLLRKSKLRAYGRGGNSIYLYVGDKDLRIKRPV